MVFAGEKFVQPTFGEYPLVGGDQGLAGDIQLLGFLLFGFGAPKPPTAHIRRAAWPPVASGPGSVGRR